MSNHGTLAPKERLKQAFRSAKVLGWQIFSQSELVSFAAHNIELAQFIDEVVVQCEFEKKNCLGMVHFCLALFLHGRGYLPKVASEHVDFLRHGLAYNRTQVITEGLDYLKEEAALAMYTEFCAFLNRICGHDVGLKEEIQFIVCLIATAVYRQEADLQIDLQVQNILRS